jgi:hypothetical protein
MSRHDAVRTRRRRVLAAGSALVLAGASAVSIAAAPSASASILYSPCFSPGKIRYGITGKAFAWVVAQKDREENFSGHYETITFEVSSSTTRANSVQVSTSVSISVNALWASFEASIGVDVGESYSKTTFASTTRQYDLASGDSYYFGQGTGRWTATATVYKCVKRNLNGDYWFLNVGSGPVKGYTGRTHSVVGCRQTVPSTSFAAVLKRNC